MATVIEEFVATLGWDVDPKGIQQFERSVENVEGSFDHLISQAKQTDSAVNQITAGGIDNINTGTINAGISVQQLGTQFRKAAEDLKPLVAQVKRFVTWTSAAAAAIGAATVAINQHTTEQTNLAKSVGLSADALIAWTGIVKEIGFEADNVVDLVEEMNNKIGEKAGLGKMTAVEESFKLLKLDFKEIRKLKPEEQFFKILDAAKELKDVQKAVSAVDMLLGGEANKILGFLRTQEESLEKILERRKALIMLDEEGREGAMKFTRVWTMFSGVIANLGQQFAGLLGEQLAPIINKFIDFVLANKKLIKTETRKWVERVTKFLKIFFGILEKVYNFIKKVIVALGGFDNALKLVGATVVALKVARVFFAIQKAIQGATAAQLLLTGASKAYAALKFLGVAAGLLLLFLILEDIWTWIQGGDSLLKDFSKQFEGTIGGIVQSLADTFGMSKDELDFLIASSFDDFIQFFVDTGKAISEWADDFVAVFHELFFGSTDIITRLETFIGDFLDLVVRFWTGAWSLLVSQLKVIFAPLLAYWGWAFGHIKEIVLDALNSIGDWFSQLWVDFQQDLVNATIALGEFATPAIAKIENELFDFFNGIRNGINNMLSDIGQFFVDIKDGIIGVVDSIVNAVSSAFNAVKNTIVGTFRGIAAQIPLVGDLIGGNIGVNPVAAEQVTGGAAAIAAPLAMGQSIQSSQQVEVQNNINVTQLPGENGTDFANRVAQVLEENTANAVRNNQTGVVY
jgi:phage-related protein